LKNWLKKVGHIESVYDLLYNMVPMNSTNRDLQRNKLLDLVSQYQKNNGDAINACDEVLNNIKLQLSGKKTVGQVALINLKNKSYAADMEDLKSNHNPIRLVVVFFKTKKDII